MSAIHNASRRDFLKTSALAGGGLVIGFTLPGAARFAQAASEFKPNAYLRIGTDDTVTVICGLSEMGQGVLTAIPMLVAEELDADWLDVKVQQAPADPAFNNPIFGMQATGGSTSVRGHWEPMRKAGATARAMLVAAAAARWKARPGGLPHRRGHGGAQQRQETLLRQACRCRGQTGRARLGETEEREGLQDSRHAEETSRYAGQDKWNGQVRIGRPSARHAHRGDGAPARARRQSGVRGRQQGQGDSGGQAGAADPERRSGARRGLLGGQAGARRAADQMGRRRPRRAVLGRRIQDAGRRRRQGGRRRPQRRRCQRCRGEKTRSRVRGALSRPCLHGADECHGMGQAR